MSVTGDPRRNTTGDGAGGAKERLRCRLVPLLTEQDVDQIPIAINGAVEVDQAPFHFDVGARGAGESPPHALTEPNVTLASHSALIVQPLTEASLY